MDEALIKEIFDDEVFVTSLLKLDTPEDVQKAVKAKGLELSLDEIKAVRDGLVKAAEKGGELNEADLEKVAGGCAVAIAQKVVITIGIVGGLGGGAVYLASLVRKRW
jgi:hypothetical protein